MTMRQRAPISISMKEKVGIDILFNKKINYYKNSKILNIKELLDVDFTLDELKKRDTDLKLALIKFFKQNNG